MNKGASLSFRAIGLPFTALSLPLFAQQPRPVDSTKALISIIAQKG